MKNRGTSQLVKMMTASLAVVLVALSASAAYTSASYVQDGLVTQWDGIDGVAKVFIRRDDASPVEARFATTCMCDRFRPIDHASLRDKNSRPRYRDVRERLVK